MKNHTTQREAVVRIITVKYGDGTGKEDATAWPTPYNNSTQLFYPIRKGGAKNIFEVSKRAFGLLLILVPLLLGCDQAHKAEELIASAEKSEKKGQLQGAADLYRKAARVSPTDFDLQFRTAVLHLKLDRLQESEEHLKQALSLRPEVAACPVFFQ